jgi:hypothetical protein
LPFAFGAMLARCWLSGCWCWCWVRRLG